MTERKRLPAVVPDALWERVEEARLTEAIARVKCLKAEKAAKKAREDLGSAEGVLLDLIQKWRSAQGGWEEE